MEVILIFRQLTDQEAEDVNYSADDNSVVYVLPGIVTNLRSSPQLIPDYIVKDASRDLIDQIKKSGDKLTDNGTLSEEFTLAGVPLWHYQRFRVFFLLRNEWVINNCIDYFAEKGTLVCYVPAGFHLWSKGLDSKVKLYHKEAHKKRKLNILSLITYAIFFKLRILISFLRRVKLKDKKHVIVDRSIRQQCRNIKTSEKKWDNFNLYPLFDLDPPGQLIISEVETPKLKGGAPFNLHYYYFSGEGRKQRTIYGEYILFLGLLSLGLYKKHKKLLNTFKTLCSKYLSDGKLTDEKELRIFKSFASLQSSTSFYLRKYLCYRHFFLKHDFVSVAAIDENSPATRCILDAGRSAGMKSIGIQHGNIGDSQPAYLYSELDREHKVMADLTITWGNYWSDFLIQQGNYPTDAVKTAGQMRSDLIPGMLKNAEDYRSGISDSPFLVTFASQPIPDSNYRYKVAYDVFACFSGIPQAKLIVKLHPAERNSADYYREIAKEAGYSDPDIRYSIDLYELLAASDLVITCYSTVGSEAVYFGKPLIIYDPFREDLLKYVKEGVAFQATDQDSLTMLVEQLINGSLAPDREKFADFISKYAFAIDGEATKRTLEFLQ